MKRVILGMVLMITVPLAIILAQQDEPDMTDELILTVENNSSHNSYTLAVQSIGATWGRCLYGYPLQSIPGDDTVSTSEEIELGLSHVESWTSGKKYFGYGKYKISVKQGTSEVAYCYFDFTTGNYPYKTNDCYDDYGADNDVYFVYHIGNEDPFTIIYDGNDSIISNGQYFSIWGLSGVPRDSICFKPDVLISGPSSLECDEWESLNTPPGYADYTSSVSHGSGSYNYAWEKRYKDADGDTSSWSSVGSDSTLRTAYDKSWMWIEIGLTVGDPGTGFSNQDIKHSNICDWDSESSLSHQKTRDSKPETFVLKQNYPNPFNPTTTLSFYLPSDEFVNITIYNSFGSKTIDLFAGKLSAGQHEIAWDGRNSHDQTLSSGIYFCRFKSNSITKTIKMLLIK